jgi:hypothetical protein
MRFSSKLFYSEELTLNSNGNQELLRDTSDREE